MWVEAAWWPEQHSCCAAGRKIRVSTTSAVHQGEGEAPVVAGSLEYLSRTCAVICASSKKKAGLEWSKLCCDRQQGVVILYKVVEAYGSVLSYSAERIEMGVRAHFRLG